MLKFSKKSKTKYSKLFSIQNGDGVKSTVVFCKLNVLFMTCFLRFSLLDITGIQTKPQIIVRSPTASKTGPKMWTPLCFRKCSTEKAIPIEKMTSPTKTNVATF